MGIAYSIEGARDSISRVLRRLIDIKRTRLNGSVKAALVEIADQTGISVAYLNRARQNQGESFAPHLHFAMRLNAALAEEVKKFNRYGDQIEDDRRSLGELWNGVGSYDAASTARNCCGFGITGDGDD